MMNRQYKLTETLLKIKNVSLTLGGNLILRDINLEIKDIVREGVTQGQVVGLLGPSGRGKTQFLKIMSGLRTPTTGQVLINLYNGFAKVRNSVLKELLGWIKRHFVKKAPVQTVATEKEIPVSPGIVGVVPQHYPLLEHRTVIGNLIIAGKQAGLTRSQAREKGLEYLRRFNLEDRKNLYPAQLSGGQRQRVCIAQQLICSAHILLMDEPFSGLDVVQQANVMNMITEVASADELNTIIVVSHDVTAASSIADTLWLMGFQKDENGNSIPGATIVDILDLKQMGLAWEPGICSKPEFLQLVLNIKDRFKTL